MEPAALARAVVEFFRAAGRDLPWRRTTDPYAIWVSEIMLQQTRVATVIPYYERWMQRFPTVRALAEAPLDEVLAAWSGLGYYSRARSLHRGAREVVERLGGRLPRQAAGLRELPGVGPYTAGAIASIAFGEREPVVDGNVMRVLARVHELDGDVKSAAVTRALWDLARELVPGDAPGDFNQGLMELGATVCTPTRPACPTCPLRAACRAHASGRAEELPRMPARRAAADLPLIDASALWIARGEDILLARRPPGGLYGGLWELPQVEDGRPEALIVGVRLVGAEPIADHRHVLSHRRLRIRVFAAELAAAAGGELPRVCQGAPARYENLAWRPVYRIERGVSSATQAIIRHVLEERQWNSTTRPSISSKRATPRSSRGSGSSATTSRTPTSRAPRVARPGGSTS